MFDLTGPFMYNNQLKIHFLCIKKEQRTSDGWVIVYQGCSQHFLPSLQEPLIKQIIKRLGWCFYTRPEKVKDPVTYCTAPYCKMAVIAKKLQVSVEGWTTHTCNGGHRTKGEGPKSHGGWEMVTCTIPSSFIRKISSDSWCEWHSSAWRKLKKKSCWSTTAEGLINQLEILKGVEPSIFNQKLTQIFIKLNKSKSSWFRLGTQSWAI